MSLAQIIRIIVFILIYFFLIRLLSSAHSTPILPSLPKPNLYQLLPENSRQKIEKIGENPAIISLQAQLNGFPQKQIKDLENWLIKSVADQLLKKIEH